MFWIHSSCSLRCALPIVKCGHTTRCGHARLKVGNFHAQFLLLLNEFLIVSATSAQVNTWSALAVVAGWMPGHPITTFTVSLARVHSLVT